MRNDAVLQNMNRKLNTINMPMKSVSSLHESCADCYGIRSESMRFCKIGDLTQLT